MPLGGKPSVLIDGIPAQALPASDRGLAYGDGLFETLAVRQGCPCCWEAHMRRLQRGAERLGIPCPEAALWLREARQLIGGRDAAVLKLILTRGSGGRGYAPPQIVQPTRVLSLHPWPNYPSDRADSGILLFPCKTRLAIQPALAGIKHLNRLEQVLARAEWTAPYGEGLMRDAANRIISGTQSNLFLFRDRRFLTPALHRCGIAGTVRQHLLQSAPQFGIPVEERDLFLSDLLRAEGVLLTNSVMGCWPVRRFEDQCYALDRLPWDYLHWLRTQVYRYQPEATLPADPHSQVRAGLPDS